MIEYCKYLLLTELSFGCILDVVSRGIGQRNNREGGNNSRRLQTLPKLHAVKQIPRQCATEQCQSY